MKLSDLLIDDWIAVPLEAANLEEALAQLLGLLSASGFLEPVGADRLAAEIRSGTHAQLIRVNDEIVLASGRVEGLEDVSVLLGIAAAPFPLSPEGGPSALSGSTRALIVLLTPRHHGRVHEQLVPALVRVLRDEGKAARLLAAGSSMEVRGFKELMQVELQDRLLVEDAVTPLRYRIYPDTPLHEVVDLMVRRGLGAVPVVGESYEVMGIITEGDALKHMLPSGRAAESEADASARGPQKMAARDVMTRSVMCVGEGQSLLEAANLMVNRDVDQLPVVREGELVGFLTRATILKLLFGGPTGGSLLGPERT